jgi:hypothetical protein
VSADARDDDQRHEPLPGLLSLPRFLVGKLGRRGRRALAVAAAIGFVAAVVGAIVLVPRIDDAKRDTAERQRREADAALTARRHALQVEQRPHADRASAIPGEGRAARIAVLHGLERAIARDARARVRAGTLSPPPPRYASCELLPHTTDPLRSGSRVGRYRCIAVTSELPRARRVSGGGVVGHPFRAVVDFRRGRYTWCKISGQPGEGSYTQRSLVRLPRACGG